MNTKKILAIQFKYLGDAVFITPALFSLRTKFPDAEIHLLVSNETAPLFSRIEWIDKIWAIPHKRGKHDFLRSSKIIYQLHKINFDYSVDFVGNERGSILSILIGAKQRLSSTKPHPKILQRIAYSERINSENLSLSWVLRHLELLYLAWSIPIPSAPKTYIASNPDLETKAKLLLNGRTVICHIGTSQPKKEWPIEKWSELYNLATAAGYKLAFSSGPNPREQNLLLDLKHLTPDLFTLPANMDMELFLAIINASELVIVGDTGPLHFAAALGTKIIGLFGTADSVQRAAPIYSKHEIILSNPCTCLGTLSKQSTCMSINNCMHSITSQQVFEKLQQVLPLCIDGNPPCQ